MNNRLLICLSLSFWLALTSFASQWPKEAIIEDVFDGATLSGTNWVVDFASRRGVSSSANGLRLQIPKGEQNEVRLYRRVVLPSDGRIGLKVDARILQGHGTLNVFLVKDPSQSRLDYGGPRLELISDPVWERKHWWTAWGTPKDFLPVSAPKEWQVAEVSAGMPASESNAWYLVICLDSGDALRRLHHADGVEFAVRSVGLTHLPNRPLDIALSQSVWTAPVLPVGILLPKTKVEQTSDAADPAADLQQRTHEVAVSELPIALEAELRDGKDQVIWQERLEHAALGGSRMLEIPRPATVSHSFKFRTRIVQGNREWLDEWNLHTPAKTAYTQDDRAFHYTSKGSSSSRFDLWADRAPKEAYSPDGMVPKEWTFRSMASHRADAQTWSPQEIERGWASYFPDLNRQIVQDDVPLPFERKARYEVAAASGTQVFILVGFHALRKISDIHLQLDHLPESLKQHITLRRMLFVPKKDRHGMWRWREGAFVSPWKSDLDQGESALYLVALNLPSDAPTGKLNLSLAFQTGDSAPQPLSVDVDVYNLTLEAPTSQYALFAGPQSTKEWRLAAYREAAAMGMNTVILYNHPMGTMRVSGEGFHPPLKAFEEEIELCREAGLPIDTAPWVLNVMFLESWITRLAEQISRQPNAKEWVSKKEMSRNIPPSNTAKEKELYLAFLNEVKARVGKAPWPKEVWIQTEDEPEYNFHAVDKVNRFGTLSREQGFRSLLTQMLTQGLDVAAALPEAVDERMPQYLNREIANSIRKSGDGIHFYTVGQHPFRSYFLHQYQPQMIANWSIYWPNAPGFYRSIEKEWSAGESFLWPGEGKRPLPTLNALRLITEVQDARILATASKMMSEQKDPTLEADFKMIFSSIPDSSSVLRSQVTNGMLPFGNAECWRRILLDSMWHAANTAPSPASE